MGYELIETQTVPSGGAASIEFTSIPQEGVDLKMLISARLDASGIATEYRFTFNGNTGSVYSTISLAGDGSGAQNLRNVSGTTFLENLSLQKNGATANTFGNGELYVSNFTGSLPKVASFTAVSENNATEAYQGFAAFATSDTSAITSIKVFGTTGNIMEHSTASLYKVTSD